MIDKPLLSISIPTYNRAEKLRQCLDCIVSQFQHSHVRDLIEVVISDNASEDNTENLAKKYQSEHNNIKYYRNEKNLGLDENVINSVIKASGKYCWHIGDDDFIQNGALKLIVEILLKEELTLLTVNFKPFFDTEKALREAMNKKHYNPKSCMDYSKNAEELREKGHCHGLLGIFIFNRTLWLKIDRANYEKHWLYYEVILKMINPYNGRLAYLKYPVLLTGQDSRWSKGGAALLVKVHAKRLFEKLKYFNYSEHYIKKDIRFLAKSLPITILSAKSFDLECSPKNLWLICKEFHGYPFILLLTIFIFFLPNKLVKIAKHIIKR